MHGMPALAEFALGMGDTALILGHRNSQWCGHSPALEEDIALANTALDLIGQAQLWLGLAADAEGKGRTPDNLAYLRDAPAYRNFLLVEQPNGDFGRTIMRQYLFDAWHLPMLKALTASSEARIAEIAGKAAKEVAYHLERSADLLAASRARWQSAGEAAFLLAPNLKSSRGGLRDWHALRALSIAQLIDVPQPVLGARNTLLALRAELHRHLGRGDDELRPQEQPAVAAALGLPDADAVLRLANEAGRTISYATDRAWRRVDGMRSGAGRRLQGPGRTLEHRQAG